MSSSFFLKGKPKPDKKRKFSKEPRKGAKSAAGAAAAAEKPPKHDPNEEIDSDAEDDADQMAGDAGAQFAFSDDDADLQTPQDKRLKLAKKYLDEIEKEERSRADDKQLHRQVSTRLADDYLDSVGKLRKNCADQLQLATASTAAAAEGDDGPTAAVRMLRHKLHKLPVTCVCLASDAATMFSGSKTPFVVKWDLSGAVPTAVGSFDCTRTPTALAAAADRKKGDKKAPRPQVIAMALSTDSKFLAVADSSNLVHIWCPRTLNHLHTFNGHRDTVTALVFRRDTHTLFSGSADRSVKVWSLDEMAYIESLFGHQAPIAGIDALSRERAITAGGFDCTIRIWKIAEESQLIYSGQRGNIEHVRLINEENFLSAGADGSLAVWSAMKKKPLCVRELAHGRSPTNGEPNWISAIAAVVNSDVIASGSCDGSVKLWKLGDHYRTIELLFEVPVAGFVNGLAFAGDASRLVVACGQEHRLGRWWRCKEATNGVLVVRLERSEGGALLKAAPKPAKVAKAAKRA